MKMIVMLFVFSSLCMSCGADFIVEEISSFTSVKSNFFPGTVIVKNQQKQYVTYKNTIAKDLTVEEIAAQLPISFTKPEHGENANVKLLKMASKIPQDIQKKFARFGVELVNFTFNNLTIKLISIIQVRAALKKNEKLMQSLLNKQRFIVVESLIGSDGEFTFRKTDANFSLTADDVKSTLGLSGEVKKQDAEGLKYSFLQSDPVVLGVKYVTIVKDNRGRRVDNEGL